MHTTPNIVVAAANGGFLQSDNLQNFLLLIAGFVIIIVGIGMAGKSNKGNLKAQANSFGSVILAVIVIGLGATAAFIGLGNNIISSFLN